MEIKPMHSILEVHPARLITRDTAGFLYWKRFEDVLALYCSSTIPPDAPNRPVWVKTQKAEYPKPSES
jgi:hypothetical protein